MDAALLNAVLKDAAKGRCGAQKNGNIRIALLPDMYPMGEERAVIREVLGQILPVDSLPFSVNVLIINVETTLRINEAVDLKKPLIDKDLTVGGKIKGNQNLIQVFEDVPLGISVRDVFEIAGGVAEEYGELIMGGSFTGKRTEMDAPVIKTTGGLIASECFMKGSDKIGLLVCACGADRKRLEELAASLGSEVVGVEYCKHVLPVCTEMEPQIGCNMAEKDAIVTGKTADASGCISGNVSESGLHSAESSGQKKVIRTLIKNISGFMMWKLVQKRQSKMERSQLIKVSPKRLFWRIHCASTLNCL